MLHKAEEIYQNIELEIQPNEFHSMSQYPLMLFKVCLFIGALGSVVVCYYVLIT